MTGPALTLVVCGAPLADRAKDVQAALAHAGWAVSVLVSDAGRGWVERGSDGGPRPDAVVACPLTFNTANKIVSGIMDTPATGTLCDALGAGLPVVVVPMLNTRLWAHPVWPMTLKTLRDWGVTLLDPTDGSTNALRAVESGTGTAIAVAFDPQWVVAAIGPARPCG